MTLTKWKNDIFQLDLIPANLLATLGVIISMLLRSKSRLYFHATEEFNPNPNPNPDSRLFQSTEELVGICKALTAGLTLERELESIKAQLTRTSVALDIERAQAREKDHKLRMALSEITRLRGQTKTFQWYRLSLAAWRERAQKKHVTKTDVLKDRIRLLNNVLEKFKLKMEQEALNGLDSGSDYGETTNPNPNPNPNLILIQDRITGRRQRSLRRRWRRKRRKWSKRRRGKLKKGRRRRRRVM